MAGFGWTEARARAALLVAEDDLSNTDIAAAVGVSRQGLDKWIAHAEFKARVAEHVAEIEAALSRFAVSKRRKRVAILQGQVDRLLEVIAERGEGMKDEAPGTATGLLVHQIKVVGTGPGQQRIDEYAVDTGLLKELREHLKQAAQEVGQWSERHEVTGKNGEPIQMEVSPARERLRAKVTELARRRPLPMSGKASDDDVA